MKRLQTVGKIQCVLTCPTYQEELFGKNGSRALSPRHVCRTLVTQTNPAVLPSLRFDMSDLYDVMELNRFANIILLIFRLRIYFDSLATRDAIRKMQGQIMY